MANDTLKYQQIDPVLREGLRDQWNRPVLWPAALLLLLVAASMVPAVRVYRRRERAGALAAQREGA